jgi:hypothetical protein
MSATAGVARGGRTLNAEPGRPCWTALPKADERPSTSGVARG